MAVRHSNLGPPVAAHEFPPAGVVHLFLCAHAQNGRRHGTKKETPVGNVETRQHLLRAIPRTWPAGP